MFDFDTPIERRGTTSIKWNELDGFEPHEDMLPFWIADTDFATVPEVIDALKKRLEHPVFGYADPKPSTFKAIQGWWERRYDFSPDTDWMFLTTGVVTAINFSLLALTDPGDKVLTFTPVYDPFFAAVENTGRTLVRCPLDRNDNYYTINWERFEDELKAGVKAVIFCNPHNPVGRVWTPEELQKLCELCVKYDAWLLCDEIHADYGLVRPYTPIGKFTFAQDKMVIYTAISKSFNLAGLVCACIMVPNKDVREKVRNEFDSRWMFGPSDLAYTAIEAAYSHGDAWMDAVCEYLKGNVKLVCDYMAENMPEIGVTRHEGTFLMWLDMTKFGMSGDELTKVLSGEYGVALGNGVHYDPDADGFMRFNIGCSRSILQKGLERMNQFCKDHRK